MAATQTNKDEIVISDFDKGIGPSVYLGFGDIRNLDILSSPGVATLNNKVTKRSGTIVDSTVNWFVRDPVNTGSLVAYDAGGSFYNTNDSGSTWGELAGAPASGGGQGAVIWKNYLVSAYASKLVLYGTLTSTAIWRDSWKTIDQDNSWHPMIISRNDGKIYGGAGRYLFSLEEASGQTFDAGNPNTYTFTQQALDLPAGDSIKTLEELGNNLMIGTIAAAGHGALKIADIFPWDRSSVSFNLPLSLNVNGVHALLTVNNILYILAGLEGKIYSSNGVQTATIGQIPLSITNTGSGTTRNIIPSPGAFINYKERPTFGFLYAVGVWSLLPTRGGNVLNLEHTISPGNTTDTSIGALLPLSQDEILIGWKSSDINTLYGIDKTDNTGRVSAFTGTFTPGYFESALYHIGNYHNKRTFREIEFQLDRPMVIGQGVALSYRTSLNTDFLIIGTYTHSTTLTTQIGAKQSHVVIPGIPSTEFVQLRVALAPGTSDANASPRLREVRLR